VHELITVMEGVHNDGTNADPPMTPIEKQMQVIATSIQDLAWETTRQNKELWHAIRKGPPTPFDDNQPPPHRESKMDDQEADSRQVTYRKNDEAQKTSSPNRHREESAGNSAHSSHQRQLDLLNLPNNPIVRLDCLEGRTIKLPV
jgi:hypothetical protein